ncbi:4'-phosphopantetheinyl transferase family protein [Pseudidiomarina mangrovi]|uniref:4'-phosphopantetheinyl transferase family protein n=1 Tax=Pseudidiomarina mangrovi TaxID=2487133 RepID=UPI0013DFE8C8|nr:hypothetical protein [Pseudidiomarina mangrovi]CAI8164448.1 MAG: Uncharacterised protein [Pseudidiomarina mangrovi]
MAIMACYCIDIAAQQAWLGGHLTAADQQQAQRYTHPPRQQQFLAARALLRWLVSEFVTTELPLEIRKYPSGAPYLLLGEQLLSCSIAHTDNAVLVGLSDGQQPFGLDIERVDAARWQTSPVVAKYQHGMMHNVGSSSLARAQRWNLAEAVVKAEQGKLLEVLQRQSEPLLAHASLAQVGGYSYAIYHPQCDTDAVSVIPAPTIG